jgi:DNA-binding Xre family transcriptional regulator
MAQAEPAERPAIEVIVAANVYRLRRMKDPAWSQERLARGAGLSRETIRLIEDARDPGKSTNAMRIDTLAVIADALSVEPAELLRYDPEATRVYLQGGSPPLEVVIGQGRSQPRPPGQLAFHAMPATPA